MQDDEKGSQEPDPWAGLDAAGEGSQGEAFDFSFDDLEPEQADAATPTQPAADADLAAAGIPSETGDAARLSIFPPSEADPVGGANAELPSETALGSEPWGPASEADEPASSWDHESFTDAAGTPGSERQAEAAADLGDDFDAQLARELTQELAQDLAERSSPAGLESVADDPATMGLGSDFVEAAENPSSGSGFGDSDFGGLTADGPAKAADEGFGGFGISDGAGESETADSLSGSSGFGSSGFGEIAVEAAGSADADMPIAADSAGAASPFAVTGSDGPFADRENAVDATAAGATAAAITAGAAAGADAGGRRRKKTGGLGQMIGVAAGGLMALPITYAILIWGFQKDPFKLGRQLPPQLAVLLPQKLQPGAKAQASRGKPAAGKETGATGSLDDLDVAAMADGGGAAADEAQADDTQPADGAAADERPDGAMPDGVKPDAAETAEAKPDAANPKDEPADAPTEEPGDGLAVKPPAAAAGDLAALLKEEMKEEPGEPAATGEPTEPAPADDAAAGATPAKPAPDDLAAALPAIGGLPGLDPGPLAGAAAAPVAEPPPLDLAGIESAVERAAVALDAVGDPPVEDDHDPARDRQLVSWYKRLARVGEELVRLEIEAADSARPLEETPAAVAGLLERIGGDEVVVADLERLGRMWLTKRTQRAEGAAIVATLEDSRQVGPYWITHTLVVEADAEQPGRKVTIVSRRPPPAEVGDRVIAAGVMFDDDTVWAAEVWPVGGVVAGNAMEDDAAADQPDAEAGDDVEMADEPGGEPGDDAEMADEPGDDVEMADEPGDEPGDDAEMADEPDDADDDEAAAETEMEDEAGAGEQDATEPDTAEPAGPQPADADADRA